MSEAIFDAAFASVASTFPTIELSPNEPVIRQARQQFVDSDLPKDQRTAEMVLLLHLIEWMDATPST